VIYSLKAKPPVSDDDIIVDLPHRFIEVSIDDTLIHFEPNGRMMKFGEIRVGD